jgi:hypothetical protein
VCGNVLYEPQHKATTHSRNEKSQKKRFYGGVRIEFVISFQRVVRRNIYSQKLKKIKLPWPESASKLHRPSDRHLSAKLVPTFVDRGMHVVIATDP